MGWFIWVLVIISVSGFVWYNGLTPEEQDDIPGTLQNKVFEFLDNETVVFNETQPYEIQIEGITYVQLDKINTTYC